MIDKLDYALNIAKSADNIRGMILFGSRANDNITPDRFSDYDILFVVAEKEKFDVSVFENVKIKYHASEFHFEQFPEEVGYLLLFDDYSRIDLLYCTREEVERVISRHAIGQPVKCLLDKDRNLEKTLAFDSSYYHVKKMNEKTFNHTCAEFFWEIQNVVKGIKRDELSYAMFLRDIAMRDMLNKMIDNFIGLSNNYSVTTGVLGRYRKSICQVSYMSYIKAPIYQILPLMYGLLWNI